MSEQRSRSFEQEARDTVVKSGVTGIAAQHIRERIARCYGRDAAVVYPPVTLPPFDGSPGKRERYVTVSRLVPYKRVDLIAQAFARLPERELVILGEGPERARIEAVSGPNVRLVGQVDDGARDAILRDARAFLFAGRRTSASRPWRPWRGAYVSLSKRSRKRYRLWPKSGWSLK